MLIDQVIQIDAHPKRARKDSVRQVHTSSIRLEVLMIGKDAV